MVKAVGQKTISKIVRSGPESQVRPFLISALRVKENFS